LPILEEKPMPQSNVEPQTTSVVIENLYGEVRAQIQHEDNLITQRLNWFLTSQSFLFTAYAIVANGTADVNTRNILLHIIPLIAITAGVLIHTAIVGGTIVMARLRAMFRTHESAARNAGLPAIQGSAVTRAMGILAPLGLPVAFVAVWIMLIIRC
jgi:hypothetical protein